MPDGSQPVRPAFVTDSNSQLPGSLRDRWDVVVVPIAVIIDGDEYLEGVNLDADGFYAFFDAGAVPEVTTSQPSPGAFVEAYRACEQAGFDEIISIHVTEALSGTLNSARLAADMVDATVHIVDTGTASFGVSCCLWRAGLALDDGADAAEAISVAKATAAELYSVTALGAAELLNRSGRFEHVASTKGVDVFRTGPNGAFDSLGVVTDEDEVCDVLADAMHADGAPIRVALGMADAGALPYYDGLERRLKERDDVVEIVRYRIGPSVGAFTGPGTAGGFWYPA